LKKSSNLTAINLAGVENCWRNELEGFASCLVVGLLVGLCALTGLGQRLLQLVPRAVKLGIIVGMGLQITLIGLKYAGLVVANETSLVALGDVYNSSVWVTLAGLVLTGTLLYFQVAGSLLIGVTLCTLCIWWVDGSWPDAIAQWPSVSTQVANTFDLTALTPGCIGGIAAMLLVELTDISGTAFGLGGLAGVMDRQGSVAREVWGSIGCGLATMLGALLGCSPINIGIESAAGIKQGGRTGLSAVVAGILFLVPAFFAPLLASVPQAATASTLILIGAVMMSESKNIAWSDMAHAIPAYITIMMMAFTFSVSNGIWFGMGSAGILYITTGDFLHRFPFQGQRRYSSFNQATSPLIDDTQGAVRHPALLISKDDADKYDIDTDEASKRQRFLS